MLGSIEILWNPRGPVRSHLSKSTFTLIKRNHISRKKRKKTWWRPQVAARSGKYQSARVCQWKFVLKIEVATVRMSCHGRRRQDQLPWGSLSQCFAAKLIQELWSETCGLHPASNKDGFCWRLWWNWINWALESSTFDHTYKTLRLLLHIHLGRVQIVGDLAYTCCVEASDLHVSPQKSAKCKLRVQPLLEV